MAIGELRDGAALSGGHINVWDNNRASPVVLRLLPYVHHPPCRVLVPGAGPGHEAAALNARGYVVTALDSRPGERVFPTDGRDFLSAADHDGVFGPPFDMICERGLFASIPPGDRDRYVRAAARVLVAGGRLFGSFFALDQQGPPWGTSAGELLHRFGAHFDVERLEPSAFELAGQPGIVLEAIFVRR